MSSEKKISLQDNFAIAADLVALEAAAKKNKAWGVLVTIAAGEPLRQNMQQTGKTVYAIIDLSDSTGRVAGQMAHDLTEIVNRVDLLNSRLLVYPMGKSAAVTLAGMGEVEGKAQLQKFSKETVADHCRFGTFIHPTLQAIWQDYQSRRDDEQPILLIFSDAEIWDWELYRDFLKGNQNFRVDFLEVGGNHTQNKIVEQVRRANKQHSIASARTAAELLDKVLPAQAAPQALIDAIALRISFNQIEPVSVMDLHEKRALEHDGNQFKWQTREGVLPGTFFQLFEGSLPRVDDVEAWKVQRRPISNLALQKLFEELKSGIAKLAAVKNSDRPEPSKIDDLQILLVNMYIPLHKKIIHEMEQKGLLQIG